jgi:hypothetical protein
MRLNPKSKAVDVLIGLSVLFFIPLAIYLHIWRKKAKAQ